MFSFGTNVDSIDSIPISVPAGADVYLSPNPPIAPIATATQASQTNSWGIIASLVQGAANIIGALRAPQATILPPASVRNPVGASAPPVNAATVTDRTQQYLLIGAVAVLGVALVLGFARK